MTEQEIIKYIKDEIEDEIDTYHWFDDTPKNKTRLQIEESINAHQGLLDLYTNAKIEINKLNNIIDRMAEYIETICGCSEIARDLLYKNNYEIYLEKPSKFSKEKIKKYFMEDK